jgi:hypothetical protein
MIVARSLTDQDVDDPSQVAPLLDQIEVGIAKVTADGAYDSAPTSATIAAQGNIEVVIPSRSTAVLGGEQSSLAESNRLWQTLAGRNDDGSLQGADRTSVASAWLRRAADRGSRRCSGAEPDAGGRTPGLRPSHARRHIADRGGGHCVLSPACAPTPA